MRIVVVSDTHHNQDILDKIAKDNKADIYLHAGDSSLPSEVIEPFIGVKGNCDFYNYPSSRIITCEGVKIYITHGVWLNEDLLVNLAKANNCKIIIYGHTHIYEEKKIADIYILNPGSPVLPRGRSKKTYMIIDIDKENKIKITKKEVQENE